MKLVRTETGYRSADGRFKIVRGEAMEMTASTYKPEWQGRDSRTGYAFKSTKLKDVREWAADCASDYPA